MQYKLSHNIETGLDTFWSLFLDPEFNRKLYLEHLKFTEYNVLEDSVANDGTRVRRVQCLPKIDIPPAAKAFFGNSAGYTEVGRFDPVARRYAMEVSPAFGGDKVKMSGQIWAEPVGPRQVTRHVTGEVTVKIFGLSKLIEKVTQQQSHDTYQKSAEFTNHWIEAKGL
jgi:hypothetical protein